MAVEVVWTQEADETFTNNITYLRKKWGDKEIRNFVQQTQKAIKRISVHPESYPTGIKSKSYRRARLNKYIVLFYKYYKASDRLVLLTFWNTLQDDSKAKFK